ncbi:hypothetical protein ACQ4PT_008374 [Festuca glaucescens]
MDPAEILTVRFHFGGEFVRIGPTLDYVGGDEAISEIERDKMSLQEFKGFLKDHMTVKDAMKFYFLLPDSDLVNGLLFLYDDAGCMKICEHTTDAGVANIYVEYQGEQDDVSQSSGSDFEADELINLDDSEEHIPGLVLTAVPDGIVPIAARLVDEAVILDNVLVPDGTGVISQVLSSPVKEINGSGAAGHKFVRMERGSSSQALNSSQPVEGEENWPVSSKPRPQAPGYVRMPGRPKKNERRREEGEAPKGKKMSRVGLIMSCGFCGRTGHNKSGCGKNPDRGKKKNAHLAKSGSKMKQAEQAQTDGAKAAAASRTSSTSENPKSKKFNPPRAAAAPTATAPTRTSPRRATTVPRAPTRSSPRRASQSASTTSNLGTTAPRTKGRKRLLDGRMKEYLTASGNY